MGILLLLVASSVEVKVKRPWESVEMICPADDVAFLYDAIPHHTMEPVDGVREIWQLVVTPVVINQVAH